MARVRTRFPRVFIGHPFKQRFPWKKFRQVFKELPFQVVYGNTDVDTKHLLAIMKRHIKAADYSIFDLSYWNPNVALELGLCEGPTSKSQRPYYVILNTNRSGDVPSDIKGIQRLEYTRYDYSPETGLAPALFALLRKEYWSKKILAEFHRVYSETAKVEKAFMASMRLLGHLKEFEKLTSDNIRKAFRGTRLRKNDRALLLDALVRIGVLAAKGRHYTLKSKKRVFR